MGRKHQDKWLAKQSTWDRASNGKARSVRAAEKRTRRQGRERCREDV